MGLSISKQFIEMHGGRIWFDSTLGEGTTFYFTLPIELPLPPKGNPTRWIVPNWVERSPRARFQPARLDQRVIICDASTALFSILDRYADDIEYVHTTNLESAAAELERCPAHAVLVNTPRPDVLLPTVQLAEQIIHHTPIIGCCIHPMTERASAARVQNYLVKPVGRKALQQALQTVETSVKRVLIADDEPDDCEVFRLLLQTINPDLEVIKTYDGKDALAQMRDASPDLVLLDIIMPEMNGWQVLEEKNASPDIADIPVIMVSAEDPAQHPVTSELILGTMDGGLSMSKLLTCSRELSELLRKPD